LQGVTQYQGWAGTVGRSRNLTSEGRALPVGPPTSLFPLITFSLALGLPYHLPMNRTWHIARGRSLPIGERTLIMGVLNLTPDSFSDGGEFFSLDKALAHAEEMI